MCACMAEIENPGRYAHDYDRPHVQALSARVYMPMPVPFAEAEIEHLVRSGGTRADVGVPDR